MKSTILKATIITALSSISTLAIANEETSDVYFGVQYAAGSYNETGFAELNPSALIGRFGTRISEKFAIEGRLGFGLQDDSLDYFGVDVAMEIDTLVGAYALAHLPINATSSVYGIIGVSKVSGTATISYDNETGSVSGDDTGLSFGLGADIGLNETIALNIEYMQYLNKSDFDYSALGFGMTVKY